MQVLHLKGLPGRVVSSLLMSLLGLNKLNTLHEKCSGFTGCEGASRILEVLNVENDIIPEQLDYLPLEGPLVTISNHAYGSIDGLLLFSIIGKVRPDYKIIANFLLAKIPELKDSFFPVNPFTEDEVSIDKSSLTGLRMAIRHLWKGGALGLFPSGDVASFPDRTAESGKLSLKEKFTINEIPWDKNVLKLVKKSGATIVPIYFDGTNSRLFHLAGKIHPMLRTALLVREMFNKKGRCIRLRIGCPITADETAEYKSIEEFGGYLRSRVYSLESEFWKEKEKRTDAKKMKAARRIALQKDKKVWLKEFEKLESSVLFETSQYKCYLVGCDDIPNAMVELGRRREETFRAISEGTGKAIDTDRFDKYYRHLILLDTEKGEIAGAYRLGIGKDIIEKQGGIKGFYTSTLFEYKDTFLPYLRDSIELGRSFVSVEYQKETPALMLLIKGLVYSLVQYPDVKYFIGPVSISSSYPIFYRSLMVKYIMEHHSADEFKTSVFPINPFQPDFMRVDSDMLTAKKTDSFEKFDRFLLNLSDNNYRFPTLVKKYIKLNSEIICFNVDPAFNNSLDGLILSKVTDCPFHDIMLLTRDVQNQELRKKILNRYGYSLKEECPADA